MACEWKGTGDVFPSVEHSWLFVIQMTIQQPYGLFTQRPDSFRVDWERSPSFLWEEQKIDKVRGSPEMRVCQILYNSYYRASWPVRVHTVFLVHRGYGLANLTICCHTTTGPIGVVGVISTHLKLVADYSEGSNTFLSAYIVPSQLGLFMISWLPTWAYHFLQKSLQTNTQSGNCSCMTKALDREWGCWSQYTACLISLTVSQWQWNNSLKRKKTRKMRFHLFAVDSDRLGTCALFVLFSLHGGY